MRPQVVTAFVGGRRAGRVSVQPRGTGTLRVPLRARGKTCTATFRVSPTAVPAVVTKGQNPDPRRLGIHFDAFQYEP
jgi:hypothetical protein